MFEFQYKPHLQNQQYAELAHGLEFVNPLYISIPFQSFNA